MESVAHVVVYRIFKRRLVAICKGILYPTSTRLRAPIENWAQGHTPIRFDELAHKCLGDDQVVTSETKAMIKAEIERVVSCEECRRIAIARVDKLRV